MSFLHNGILMAILAHSLIGVSLLWDKILLRNPGTQNLVSYVFWMGAMSAFGVILAFFGFRMPAVSTALLAMGAGALQLVAVYFYYKALKRGEASETLAIMGGFSPVATALVAAVWIGKPWKGEALSFMVLVAGGFIMFFGENLDYRKLMPPVLLASGLYGIVNVAQKVAFENSNFVSGYVFFTLGTFAGSMLLLVRRCWREQIFRNTGSAEPRSKLWYFVNRFVNGVGSFLIFYAISLANPAMVDAISGARYALIFIGAYVITRWKPAWLQEEFRGAALIAKVVATLTIAGGLVLAGLGQSSETSATPHATRQAPSQRCQWTSSFRIVFARMVSIR